MKRVTEFDKSKAEVYEKLPAQILAYPLDEVVIVPTLEGDHIGNKGDYLIQGVKGEIYPCKPDIFEATYKKVVNINPSDNKCETVVTVNISTLLLKESTIKAVCHQIYRELKSLIEGSVRA